MARKIALIVKKGGSGKTTTSTNLSTALAKRGHRVLLVDLDSQANATSGVGIVPYNLPATLNDVFAGRTQDPHQVIVTSDFGVDVLPAHEDLDKTAANMEPDDIFALREILAQLDADYDFMFIDTYGTTGYLVYNALAAANEIIIPMKAGSWSDSGVAQALSSIQRARQRYNAGLKLSGILPTMVDHTIHTATLLEDAESAYADLLYPMHIIQSTKVNQANTLGMPIVIYEPSHPAAIAYEQLAERLSNEQQA